MTWMILIFFLLLGILLTLSLLVTLDRKADRGEWTRLAALQPMAPGRFSHEMIADLPEPARRYFTFTILPGTLLFPVAEIDMDGQFSLGTRESPNYQPMEARQILALPQGFVWMMRTRAGLPVCGSDSGHWTRFRIFGLIPVARLGNNPDHARSAFGRYAAEAVFWTPAALLPCANVWWEAVDRNTARVTISHGSFLQAVDVTVDAQGCPTQVCFQRWSDANAEKTYRLQPFGGYLSDFREIEGFRLPYHVEAGNLFGTTEYFPFFVADVRAIRFPGASG
jgi:hypothetical protein